MNRSTLLVLLCGGLLSAGPPAQAARMALPSVLRLNLARGCHQAPESWTWFCRVHAPASHTVASPAPTADQSVQPGPGARPPLPPA